VPTSPALNQLDSWIAIAADGSITAYSGKEELGQGISTAQQQLVAEELSVPFNRVKLIYCDTALTPDQAHTSGSQSHPANSTTDNLGQAGATAREALFRMASQTLGVPIDQLTASDGVISGGSRRVTYGATGRRQEVSLALDPKAKRKSPSPVDRFGQADSPPRSSRSRNRKIRVRPQRAFTWHAARTPWFVPPSVDATMGVVASVDERKLDRRDAGRSSRWWSRRISSAWSRRERTLQAIQAAREVGR